MGNWITRLALLAGVTILGLGTAVGCTQAPAAANTPEQFYKGKTLTFVVSSGTGGENDPMARIVASYLSKEIGATVRVENMGTDEGINYTYNEAPQDGLTMVTKSTDAVISNDILKAPGTNYETEKFNFVAVLALSGRVFETAPKLPYKTLDELRKAKGLKAGGTTAKGSLATSAALMFEIMGLDGKVIAGYKAKKDLTLAIGRNEVDFMVTSDNGANKDEADGYVVNVAVVGTERSRVIPNVPTLEEFGVKVPKELEAAREYMSSGGYLVALTPNVPQDRVDYLRKAFQKLNDDKDLQNEVEKLTGTWIPFVHGAQLQQKMSTIKANKGLAEQIDAIFKKYAAAQ
ncbi:MAG: hypothetical protein HYY30_14225 [Chloroflexi bacterium]|nr:hypothetical protein [Chloroflexota bacterium]